MMEAAALPSGSPDASPAEAGPPAAIEAPLETDAQRSEEAASPEPGSEEADPATAEVEEADPATAEVETTPAAPPTSLKANAPIFSESRRKVPTASALENKKVMRMAAALALLFLVFLGTYMGANFVFRSAYGTEVASAGKTGDPKGGFSAEKQHYIDVMDRKCARSSSRFEGLEKRILGVDSPAEMERLFDRMSSKIDQQMDKMESMKKPKEDRRLLDRILALHRQVIPFLDRMLAAVQQHDLTAVETLGAEAYANAAKSRRLMDDYGFQVCGRV